MIITVKTRTLLGHIDEDNKIVVEDYYFASGMPCRECLDYLKNLGIKKIYYSTLDGCFEMIKTNQESSDDYVLSDAQNSFLRELAESKSKKKKQYKSRNGCDNTDCNPNHKSDNKSNRSRNQKNKY